MNPVISRDYVEKNYVHKDKIKELIKECYEKQVDDDVLTYLELLLKEK